MNDLQKSAYLDNWYVIDGAPFGQPEGTAEDWREIIAAIKASGHRNTARRVSVTTLTDGSVRLRSPRNAHGEDDFASVAAADLAAWIEHAENLLAAPINTKA